MFVKDVILAVLFNNHGKRYDRIAEYNRTMRENGVRPEAGKLGQLRVELVAAQSAVSSSSSFTIGRVKAVRDLVRLLQLVEEESAKKANLTAGDVRQALLRAKVRIDLLLELWESSDKGYADIASNQLIVDATLQLTRGGRSLSPEEHAAAYDMAYETELWAERRLDVLVFRSNWLFKMCQRLEGLSSEQKDALHALLDMPLSEWLNGEASHLMRESGLVVR